MPKYNDFGSVDQLASGRFRARFRQGGVTHKAPQTFETKGQAQAWLNAVKEKLDSKYWNTNAGSGDTFRTWADKYVARPRTRRKRTTTGVTSKKSTRTINDYESTFNKHVNPILGDMPIGDIDVATIRDFQDRIEDKLEGKSRTIEKVQLYTSWVMQYALSKGAINFNPWSDDEVVLPDGAGPREWVDLVQTDIERLKKCFVPQYQLVPLLVAYTGLRAGEVWALRRKSIVPMKRELIVSHSVDESNRMTMGPTKNGQTRRIALPQFLFDALGRHLVDHSLSDDPNDWIFTSPEGFQVRHSNFMEKQWRPAKRRAEIDPRTRFHDLRHYCAHWHISAGFEPGDIKELLGHRSITVTMDVYGGLFDSRRRAMADRAHSVYEAEAATPSEIAPVVPISETAHAVV